MKCPCGTGKEYKECCGPFLNHSALPETAEQLMRSRYTAYTKVDMDYIEKTLAPESRADFDSAGARAWAEQSAWRGLEIHSVEKGNAQDTKGTVEFTGTYEIDGKPVAHREVSRFRKNPAGQWFFIDGEARNSLRSTVVREEPKIGRNDPCSCGSGKKFKKCCAA